MDQNPYRRDVELSPRMQWVGGVLFVVALATPFAVISLVGDNAGRVALVQAEPTLPDPAPDDWQARVSDPGTADLLVLAAAKVGPVSVLHPTTAPAAPVPVPLDAAGHAAMPLLATVKPADHRTGAKLNAPQATFPTTAPAGKARLPGTRAPRAVPLLASVTEGDGNALPLSVASDLAAHAEQEMALSRANRREIQLRLSLMGHDPHGIDGIFGKQTRAAIREAQAALAVPETGYLDAALLGRIEEATEKKLTDHRIAARKRARQLRLTMQRKIPADKARVPKSKNSPECRRNAAGEITENQSISCDWALLGESVGALFERGG